MTQENKELLLKDLSARLPYELIGEYSWKGNKPYNRELTGNLYDELKSSWSSTEDSKFLPYLRPISSMTEEEYEQYCKFSYYGAAGYRNNNHKKMVAAPSFEKMDFLNAHHFDYRNLIEKGLALEALKDMYNLKEK